MLQGQFFPWQGIQFESNHLIRKDPYWSSVLLLLHMDGADGSTTFTDSSASGRTVTAVGNAQIDTAQSKFGGASGLFDGTGDRLTVPDSADWAFAGDFTVETWIRISSLAAIRWFYGQNTDANNYIRWRISTNGSTNFEIVSGGVTAVTLTSAASEFTTNTWYHVALVRSGNDWTIYKDGSSIATVNDNSAYPNVTSALYIGSEPVTSGSLAGWFDDFRISNRARYTAAFTPPTLPFPNR